MYASQYLGALVIGGLLLLFGDAPIWAAATVTVLLGISITLERILKALELLLTRQKSNLTS